MNIDEYYDEDWEFEDALDISWWHEKGYWTTKDGDRIKFTDLEDHHLLNIDMLLRKQKKISQWPEITKEIKNRKLLDPSVPLMERLKF